VGDITGEAGVDDSAHHRRPEYLLAFTELMPPWDPTCVVMMKPLGVRPDGLNHVTFHDLHVIDVVKQFGIGLPTASTASRPHAVESHMYPGWSRLLFWGSRQIVSP
jgi:hypothetical protein